MTEEPEVVEIDLRAPVEFARAPGEHLAVDKPALPDRGPEVVRLTRATEELCLGVEHVEEEVEHVHNRERTAFAVASVGSLSVVIERNPFDRDTIGVMATSIELDLLRDVFHLDRTLGVLRYDGKAFGWTAEDADRGLTQGMTLGELAALKVPGRTCIAAGYHPIILADSGKYGPNTLTVLVPGHRLIRVHPGNDEGDTEGCILPGLRRTATGVAKSAPAVEWLERNLVPHLQRGGDAFLRVRRGPTWKDSPLYVSWTAPA